MSLYSQTECRKRDTPWCSTLYSFPFFSLENLFTFWQTLNLPLHTIITPVIPLYYISKILSIMPRHYTQSTILHQHLQLSYVTIVSVGLVNNANSLNLNGLYITSSKKNILQRNVYASNLFKEDGCIFPYSLLQIASWLRCISKHKLQIN